ncbi:MAG: dodecin family protein [Bacteroidota bacterium]
MPLAKVIEVMSEGSTMEEAVQNAVNDAAKTIHNIKSVYVENIQAIVENEKVTKYRIDAKITFILD